MFLPALSQSFDLQVLGRHQEGAEVLLGDVDLPVVDEVEDGLEVGLLDPLEVDKRVVLGQTPEQVTEKRTGGGEDEAVDLDVVIIITSERQVEQFIIISEVPN